MTFLQELLTQYDLANNRSQVKIKYSMNNTIQESTIQNYKHDRASTKSKQTLMLRQHSTAVRWKHYVDLEANDCKRRGRGSMMKRNQTLGRARLKMIHACASPESLICRYTFITENGGKKEYSPQPIIIISHNETQRRR